MQLVQASGKAMKDQDIFINRNEFGHGYTMYAFDLTPDHGCSEHYSLIKTGNLRAEIHFAQHLPITINKILYGVFDNVIEINHSRNILFDYM